MRLSMVDRCFLNGRFRFRIAEFGLRIWAMQPAELVTRSGKLVPQRVA